MPELANERGRIERDIQRRITAAVNRHAPRIVDALGRDARDTLANTAGSVWAPFERTLGEESYWPLLLAFLSSYDNFDRELGHPLSDRDGSPSGPEQPGLGTGDSWGVPQSVSRRPGFSDAITLPKLPRKVFEAADRYAGETSGTLARGIVIGTVDRLDKTSRRFDVPPGNVPPGTDQGEPITSPPEPPVQPSVPPAAPQPSATEPKPESLDWDREFSKTLGKERIERIGVTETTGSLSAGEYHLKRRLEAELGWDVEAIWNTERDARVCPICRPLDGTVESYFGPRVGAPPAHPNCRCWLTYNVKRKPQEARV